MKEQTITTVQVKGRGETKQKAFAAALNRVQSTVIGENSSKIILQIKPLDIAVVNAVKSVRREKFFFFFFPRDRETYDITLDVNVDVTTIDVEKIEFDFNNKK